MNSSINLKPLYEAQSKLDECIAKNHQVTYEKTRKDRLVALMVEICEWANETRCFKYWSNKGPSPKEITIEEYADALHFFLSIGIDIKTSFMLYSISSSDKHSLSEEFLALFNLYSDFVKKQDDISYQKAFSKFIDMARLSGFEWKEVENAYFRKLEVNFKRQESNY